MNEIINSANRIESIIYRIISIVFGIVFALIVFVCTFLNGIEYGRKELLEKLVSSVPGIAFLLIGSGALFFFSLLFFRNKRRDYTDVTKKHLMIILFISVAFLAFQITASFSYYFYTDWDAGFLRSVSEIVARGEVPGEAYDDYFSRYPNNLTLVNIFSKIIALTSGIGTIPVFSLILFQCFINWVTGLLLFFSVARLFENGLVPFFSYIMYIALVGISPWVSIPYSDSVALLFPMLIFFIYTRRDLNKGTIVTKWLLIGFVTYLGYTIKPQVIFVTVSLIIVLSVHLIFNKKCGKKNIIKGVICTAGIIIAFFSVNNINNGMDINVDGQKTFGAKHFLMMGFNSEAMGVYSGEDVAFSGSFKTKEERDRADMEKVSERIRNMGVAGFSRLMVKKTLTNYYDGSFCWGGEGSFYYEVLPDQNAMSPFFKNVYYNRRYEGKYNYAWTFFEQCVWMGTLTLSIFSVFIKKPGKETVILLLTLLILTVFQTLFEARARYLFIYAPFYIMLATYGCSNINCFIKQISGKRKTDKKTLTIAS